MNPFLYRGDMDAMDQLYTVQIGKIVSVDEDNATVNVQWADKDGGRMGVPFPMPFAGNGWGVWVMPCGGETCLIGFRQNQFPVILAWQPCNIATPNSSYQNMLGLYGATQIKGGEIYSRSRMAYANCKKCHHVSLLSAWNDSASRANGTKMDMCPICGAPAIDKTVSPPVINKLYVGGFSYLFNDGSFTIAQEVDLANGFRSGANFTMNKDGSVILKDKLGNRIETDTSIGSIKIQQSIITKQRTSDQSDDSVIKDGSSVELGDDGSVTVQQVLKKDSQTVEDGASITMDATGGVTILPKNGKVVITIDVNGNVNVTADSKIVLEAPEVDIGDASAKALAVADSVAQQFNAFITAYNAHMNGAYPLVTPYAGQMSVGNIGTTKAKGS